MNFTKEQAKQTVDVIESWKKDAERYRVLRKNHSASINNVVYDEWDFFSSADDQLDDYCDELIKETEG